MTEGHILLINKEDKHKEKLMLWPSELLPGWFGKETRDSSFDEVTLSYKPIDPKMMRLYGIYERCVTYERVYWSKPMTNNGSSIFL